MGNMEKSENEPAPGTRRVLHRLGAIRKMRKLSLADVAQRLHLTPEEAQRQEQSATDLTLRDLYRWQQLLKVPLAELLAEPDETLGLPAVKPEKLSPALEVALLILQQTKQPGIRRMAHTLVDQLVELSPELKRIAEEHTAGQAHRLDEQGRAMKGALPVDFFLDPIE
jgi:transcriptional regulator with XRE-family HTH domain